jgi:hypothetical protein
MQLIPERIFAENMCVISGIFASKPFTPNNFQAKNRSCFSVRALCFELSLIISIR